MDPRNPPPRISAAGLLYPDLVTVHTANASIDQRLVLLRQPLCFSLCIISDRGKNVCVCGEGKKALDEYTWWRIIWSSIAFWCADLALRGLPLMTPATILEFFYSPSPLSANSRNLPYLSSLLCLLLKVPPSSPQCGRHKWKPPKAKALQNDPMSRSNIIITNGILCIFCCYFRMCLLRFIHKLFRRKVKKGWRSRVFVVVQGGPTGFYTGSGSIIYAVREMFG